MKLRSSNQENVQTNTINVNTLPTVILRGNPETMGSMSGRKPLIGKMLDKKGTVTTQIDLSDS